MAQDSSRSPYSTMVVFNSCLSSNSLLSDKPILTSWRNGPQKLTGLIKRGRPKKEPKPLSFAKTRKSPQPADDLSKSNFDFITYTGPTIEAGPHIRKAVRSHVMLNYRRQERKLLEQNVESAMLASVAKLFPNEISTPDPFQAFPVETDGYMLNLFSYFANTVYEKLYSIEKYGNYNPVKEHWLPMAFQDEALLHATMFCADDYVAISRGTKERPAAVMHLRHAIRIVNERLSAPVPNLSDPTIVVVCLIAHAEKLNGNHENWKTHMSGLKQMVHLRGGMQAFEVDAMVRCKINRADMAGSIDSFQKPYFDFLGMSPAIPELPIDYGFPGLRRLAIPGTKLASIISGIQCVTSRLNQLHLNKFQLHPQLLRENITSLQYALLSTEFELARTLREDITSLQYTLLLGDTDKTNTPDDLICEALRLGSLMYLVSILNESPPGTSICDMLGARLKTSLEGLKANGALDPEYSLWLMFVGASLVGNLTIKQYFMESAVEAIRFLGLSSWRDGEVVFKKFPWVERIHGESFIMIWNSLEL